jgi:transposase
LRHGPQGSGARCLEFTFPGALRRGWLATEPCGRSLSWTFFTHAAPAWTCKDTVVAAFPLASGGKPKIEIRTFNTTTPGLLALSDWLAEHGCTHVAMEATGVYWKPVWQILADGTLTLILTNPAHVRSVPGRETDVADAAWLADLLAHGLIRASFVPDSATQAMRGLLRTRKQLVREQASHIQRVQKVLEEANLKLASVVTDIIGLSDRAVLKALIEGETDPDRLLALIDRRVNTKLEPLHAALTGRITDHHRFLLRLHLRQIDALNEAVAEIDQQVHDNLAPFRTAVRQVCAVAASMLTAIFHMLRDSEHFQTDTPQIQAKRLAQKIAKLGFACTIKPLPAEASVSV